MAGVLNGLASYVTKMLADMARDEVALLIGVTGKIDDLSVKLGDLKNFLADADRRMITDESVQGWVEELKRAMYQATDILDLCQLKAMEKGPSKDKGCLNPLLFCMRNPLHAHDIGSRIKTLNDKLNDICTRGRSFNFIKLEAYQDRRTTRPPVSRKTDPLLERSSVVGEMIEEDTRALVEMLTKEASDESEIITVVAIVGIGGIGKTTLCKNIFNHESIQDKFVKKMWLSITQECDEVELLRTAITAADGHLPGPGGGTHDKSLLVPALASAIRDKKFFLVLDDMWGFSEWNNFLKPSFSHGAPRSQVLITTRDDKVARGMKAVHPYHHVDKLGAEDAWKLLKSQVLTPSKCEPNIEHLRDVGLQIIEKCDGLPLAIKVMGGLLCQREKERRAWVKVLNNEIWSVSQMPQELNYAMYLSYEDLPPCLKQCFLHFALKPKRIILPDAKLVSMWISEGFVHGNSNELEEIGHDYFKELILRNLIEPIENRIGQYECNMHDVVRSFAQYVTRNDALVAHNGEVDNSKLTLQRFLQLSIEIRVESDEFCWRSLYQQTSIRSLMFFGNLKIQSGDSFNRFSSLRTLHIESANLAALVEYLYQLKHLRYLSVQKCNDITSLPEEIDKLKFLQVIDLDGCENFVKLPNSVIKLEELRCIDLDMTSANNMPKGFCALTNLRTLFGFQTHMDDGWCSLEELGPLCNLRYLGLVGLQNVSAASFATNARLREKVHLSLLVLHCTRKLGSNGLVKDGVTEKDQGLIEEVFDALYPPPCTEDIRMKGYFGRKLPIWLMIAPVDRIPLNSMRILTMHDLPCCTQFPDGLSQLPCLEYLKVSRAPAIKSVGPEFVQPNCRSHHTSSHAVAAFGRLHKMILNRMVEWEEWEWQEEVQAMPALEVLYIQACKLRCIPPGLGFHARSLKKMTIGSVKGLYSLENFASVVELVLYHIPYLTRISNFPKLQKLEIKLCPKLESLQEINALRRLVLTVFYSEKQLPAFLQTVKPSHLLLDCSLFALCLMCLGQSGPEWEKFRHIQRVEAYSNDEGIEKRWHVFYTSEPYSMETNIDLQGLREAAGLSSGHEGGADVDNSQYENEEERMAHDRQLLLDIQQYLIREAEADVENNQDENEEKRIGHALQELPGEIVPSGVFRSSDEDVEDLSNKQDKSEEEIKRRMED